ncbi:MAG TPA: hypothetical protein VJR90_09695 [Gammaproteobacteria bacterium]|nr:hypothetical protein [Gammaproteobacteria bacterium]
MKYLLITGLALFTWIACNVASAEITFKGESPELKAIIPKNNDITPGASLKDGTEAIPQVAQTKIVALVSAIYAAYKKNCSLEQCDEPSSSFYGPIFRLRAPNDETLYVFETMSYYGGINYFLILFDKKTARITVSPPSIYAKWLDMFYGDSAGLLQRPFVNFSKIGGSETLVVEDYAHNGDAYNAALYRYFCIQNNLALTPILTVERRALWPFEKNGSANILIRNLRLLKNHVAEINVYLQSLTNNQNSRLVGKVILQASASCEPYHIVKVIPLDNEFKKFSDALITVSETDINKFIVTGDDLFY